MREIKFRFWKKETKQMFPDVFAPETPSFGDVIGVIRLDFEMMQFTGLKDKNGKEIYEGDIVQYQQKGTHIVAEVVFEKSGFNVKDFYESSQNDPSMAFAENHLFWVVGNICENPELLKTNA
jgi:uncharacterized phage protein (TIGR01671 family)